MKRLIASVIVIVAFTFYAIFSRDSSTQTVTSAVGDPTASTARSATTLPVATEESDDDEEQQQTPVTTPPSTASTTASSTASSRYADGTYTGAQVNALYGVVQVQAVIQGGRIADVQVLSHPTGRRSDEINAQAVPVLTQEAISSQSATVQVVSGATLTSNAFMQSLQSALDQA